MKAVINLDVPEWQIGKDAFIYFNDTMSLHAACENNESVKPKWHELGVHSCWECGNCGEGINYESYVFCPYCGRKVKWDETG